MKLDFSRQVFEKSQISNFMKIRPLGGGLLHANGWTDGERVMTKLFAILRTLLRMFGYSLQKSYRNLVRITSDQYCLFPRTSVAWVRTITDCWPSVTGNVCVTVRQQQPGYRLSAQEHWNSLDRRLYRRRTVNAKLGGGGGGGSRAKRHKEAGVVRSVPVWANSEPSKNTSPKYNGR
jgi:hypothetical protein